jgi:hypothetical protein
MSRPKLTSLSAIMPPKGGAVRAEPVAEPIIKQASEKANKLVGMQDRDQADEHVIEQSNSRAAEPASEISGKQASGQASSPPNIQAIEPFDKQTSKRANMQTSEHPITQTSERAREQAGLHDPSQYKDGPRSAVSFRMTEILQKRLREYAHRARQAGDRRTKQDILDQAVHEFLLRAGF